MRHVRTLRSLLTQLMYQRRITSGHKPTRYQADWLRQQSCILWCSHIEGELKFGFFATVGEPVRVYDTLQESITAEVTTPPSAILRQGTDITAMNPDLTCQHSRSINLIWHYQVTDREILIQQRKIMMPLSMVIDMVQLALIKSA